MFGGVILIYENCSKLAEFIFKKKNPISQTFWLINEILKNYVSKFKFFWMVKD